MLHQRGLKLGIIKGGQLGRMLAQAAVGLDVQVYVLDDDPNCPCRSLCQKFVQGDCLNFDDVFAFGKSVDVLTLEYEHVNVDALKALEAQGVAVRPSSAIIELVQDKGRQKEFYRKAGIPTADFVVLQGRSDLNQYTEFFPAVQKTCRDGYDGKGIYKISSLQDIDGAFDIPSVLERLVNFDKEIAVIVARNSKGDVAVYPPVEMMFHPKKNLVEFLSAPSHLPAAIQDLAKSIALKLAETLGMVGVLAVEMFVTKSGQVLVNEIAPRVHNSGHHTLEANLTSQFEQHLRAILGLPLGPTDAVMPSVMVNLLGDPCHEGPARYEGLNAAMSLGGVYVHLYGKQITKPYRKMGHATVLDRDPKVALAKARQVKEMIRIHS